MTQNKRRWFALVIVVVILLAVFASFAINHLLRQAPSITLPDISPSTETNAPGQNNGPTDENGFLQVDVTSETVQEVIRTLSRPDSYRRSITIEFYWEEESSDLTSLIVWQDGVYSRVEVSPPTGLIQYNLISPDHFYRWYSGSSSYTVLPLDTKNMDLAQRIPTYEDVLEVERNTITDAGYVLKENIPCIYMEAIPSENRVQRYWISIQSGLLVGAELLESGQLVYAMSSYLPPETPCPTDADFSLPDGTVLHSVVH